MSKIAYQLNERRLALLEKQGAIEFDGSICPFIDVESDDGKLIAQAEHLKHLIDESIQLIDHMLAAKTTEQVLIKALHRTFLANINELVKTTLFEELINEQALSTNRKALAGFNHLVADIVKSHLVDDEETPNIPALKLALKPMEKGEGLYCFYCFQSLPLQVKTRRLLSYRKFMVFAQGSMQDALQKRYKALFASYQDKSLTALYGLAYKNIR